MKEVYLTVSDNIYLVLVRENGRIKIEKGFLSDFGWIWTEGGEFPQALLYRIIMSRLFWDFVEKWEENGLTFRDFKNILASFENKEQEEELLYTLTGDNNRWRFGTPFNFVDEDVWEEIKWSLAELGFSEEEVEEILNKLWWDLDFKSNFKDYSNHYQEWLERFKEEVWEAKGWWELQERLEILSDEIQIEIDREYAEVVKRSFWRIWEERKKKKFQRR